MLRPAVLLVAAVILGSSCTEPQAGPVRIAASHGRIVLANKTTVERFYYVADPEWLALVEFFCAPEDCLSMRLAPLGSVDMAVDSAFGYSDKTRTLTAYHWRREIQNGRSTVVDWQTTSVLIR